MAVAVDLRKQHPRHATASLGRNCHMPNALQTPLQVCLYVEHLMAEGGGEGAAAAAASAASCRVGAGGATPAAAAASAGGPAAAVRQDAGVAWYKLGVRLAIREGGCCASRAAYVGAALGARLHLGLHALPADWVARYPQYNYVVQQTRQLLQLRGL